MSKLTKTIQKGWQVFRRRCEPVEYVLTRRGLTAHLVRFDALCAACGKRFTAQASKGLWKRKQIVRRCERHRKMGVRVNNDKPPIPNPQNAFVGQAEALGQRWQRQTSEASRRAKTAPDAFRAANETAEGAGASVLSRLIGGDVFTGAERRPAPPHGPRRN